MDKKFQKQLRKSRELALTVSREVLIQDNLVRRSSCLDDIVRSICSLQGMPMPFAWKKRLIVRGEKGAFVRAQYAISKVEKQVISSKPKWKAPDKGFYMCKAWRELRYKALKKHGAKCQCCGATPESSGKPMHVDHVKPRSKFPNLELVLSNLQILCEDCNLGKGGWDETDWRETESKDELTAEYHAVMGRFN